MNIYNIRISISIPLTNTYLILSHICDIISTGCWWRLVTLVQQRGD